MAEPIEIKGGADAFEAAAVAAIITHVLETEAVARSAPPPSNRPPAWMRAVMPKHPDDPYAPIWPE